jgi:hypothetical protein
MTTLFQAREQNQIRHSTRDSFAASSIGQIVGASQRNRYWLAAALAAVLLASMGTAGAADEDASFGAIRGKDTHAQIIVIDGKTFAVTPRTIIRGPDGGRIQLSEIDVPDEADGEAAFPIGLIEASFTAETHDKNSVLLSLDLMPLVD